ncbi:MAG: 50S ribosomal protein L21 [Myxococcales bacterium]|nr:50S ribosomal protein L21 [Myxococcota bacterium]MDW8280724.1 50S ribosomal protein L21 [Myxococcales bacterium]
MYAVIETGGKQYKVQPGERLRVEKLGAEPGARVSFPVLLLADGTTVQVGTPTVPSARVTAEVLGEEKGAKLIIYKFRRRKGYRRRTGHRQMYTALRILDITSEQA